MGSEQVHLTQKSKVTLGQNKYPTQKYSDTLSKHHLLHLQQIVGNREVQRLLAESHISPTRSSISQSSEAKSHHTTSHKDDSESVTKAVANSFTPERSLAIAGSVLRYAGFAALGELMLVGISASGPMLPIYTALIAVMIPIIREVTAEIAESIGGVQNDSTSETVMERLQSVMLEIILAKALKPIEEAIEHFPIGKKAAKYTLMVGQSILEAFVNSVIITVTKLSEEELNTPNHSISPVEIIKTFTITFATELPKSIAVGTVHLNRPHAKRIKVI